MDHRLTIRVYYEDTDLAGVVYYANYLKFMERGRTEALREAGIDQVALKRDLGLVFVVRSLSIDYLVPARFDDLIEVRTRITRLRNASVDMAQEVRRGETCLAGAAVVAACMDGRGRPARLPAGVKDGMRRFAAAE